MAQMQDTKWNICHAALYVTTAQITSGNYVIPAVVITMLHH